jgi:hypothetical protein
MELCAVGKSWWIHGEARPWGVIALAMDVEVHADLWGFLGGEGLDYLGRKIRGCSPLTMLTMGRPPQSAAGDVGEIGGCAVCGGDTGMSHSRVGVTRSQVRVF